MTDLQALQLFANWQALQATHSRTARQPGVPVHALSALPHCVGGFGVQPGGSGIALASLHPTDTEPADPDEPDAPPPFDEPDEPPLPAAPPDPPTTPPLDPPAPDPLTPAAPPDPPAPPDDVASF